MAGKCVLAALLTILLISGLCLGGYEVAKAMGKKNLMSASDGVRPELQTAIGANELS